MAVVRRLVAGGFATLLALTVANLTAYGATKPIARPLATPHPTPVAPKKQAAIMPPEIYQLDPIKVNPTVQPNVMITGQHMTAATVVSVGGHPAETVQVPDTNHVLVKLPDNLSTGTYTVEVSNEAGTAVAADALQVDDGSGQFSTLQYAAAGGFLVFLVLAMRLARTPSL